MYKAFKDWCSSNSALARCTRTIAQGVVGVLVANVDYFIGTQFDPQTKAVLVALTMAVLSPVQAMLRDEE